MSQPQIDRHGRLMRPLVVLLEELTELINLLTDAQYVQRPVGPVDASVGAHVRHALDHVRHLLSAPTTGEINYDVRDRGTRVESCRQSALEELAALMKQLREIHDSCSEVAVVVRTLLSADEPAIEVRSSFGREVAFTISHTIHHNALLAAMAKTLGARAPERLGYAPSTLRHLQTLEAPACAR
jgi:uncharacterized damage-inducible protein DinB